MSTAREEFEAYAFVSRRQSLALLTGDDLTVEDPRRRVVRAVVGGVLIGVLTAAVCGAAALIGAGHGHVKAGGCAVSVGTQPASVCTLA